MLDTLYAIFINTITEENQMKRLNTLFHIKSYGFNRYDKFVSLFYFGKNHFLLVEPQISNYWDGHLVCFVTSTAVGTEIYASL